MLAFVIGSCPQLAGGLLQPVHFLYRPQTPRHAHTLTPSQVSKNENDFPPFLFVLLSVGLCSWVFSSPGKYKGRGAILSHRRLKARTREKRHPPTHTHTNPQKLERRGTPPHTHTNPKCSKFKFLSQTTTHWKERKRMRQQCLALTLSCHELDQMPRVAFLWTYIINGTQLAI